MLSLYRSLILGALYSPTSSPPPPPPFVAEPLVLSSFSPAYVLTGLGKLSDMATPISEGQGVIDGYRQTNA